MKTKKWNILTALLLLCLALTACSHDDDDYIDQIMIRASPFAAANYTAYLQLSGENLQVDWGDGSRPDEAQRGDKLDFRHNYPSRNQQYTITIKGRHITLLAIGELNGGTGYFNTCATFVDPTLAPNLQVLDCANNPINVIDLSRNRILQHLYCDRTRLTALNVYYNTNLVEVDCSYCNMSTYGYNDFLNSLHPYPITGKTVYIGQTDPNIRTADFNIAISKGWFIYPY